MAKQNTKSNFEKKNGKKPTPGPKAHARSGNFIALAKSLTKPPKADLTFKKFEHKYKDTIVDFFAENNKKQKSDDFTFNFAPIVKKKEKFQKNKNIKN
jgi:hypothetical protein